MTPCDCELRDRQWNGFGRCLRCSGTYGTHRFQPLPNEKPLPPVKLTLADLWKAVKAWREAKCQVRCDECDPSFTCFGAPSPGTALCRKPNAARCDGDNHIADCPVELARQDVIATHDRTSP